MSVEFFKRQLEKLPDDRRLFMFADKAKICCPFIEHKGGKEHTPSLQINLKPDGRFKAGRFFCFGCSAKGDWNDLAKVLKLKKYDGSQLDTSLAISDNDKISFFGIDDQIDDFDKRFSKLDKLIEFSPLWPKKEIWRSISGKILHKLEARAVAGQYGTKLYLPIYIKGKFYGGITCRLTKSDKYPSYINDPGPWIKEVVYPFDYTKTLLKQQNKRVLFYVEGPRDVLNPLQYDVPTVANLGGITVWNSKKADLIQQLNPELLIIATDPDEVGEKLAEAIKSDLGKFIDMRRLKFPRLKSGEKSDPGNTTKKRWLHLKYKLGLK